MKDLDGIELEVGAIYHILGSGNRVVIGKFSHETESSFVFKPIKKISVQGMAIIYSWKRLLNKLWTYGVYNTNLPVIRVSQHIIDTYQIV